MDKLTEKQKLLIQLLKAFGVEEGAVAGIMLAMKTEQNMEDLVMFLSENRQATQSDILGAVTKIVLAEKNKEQA